MSGGSTPPSPRTATLMHTLTRELEKFRVEINTRLDNERRRGSHHEVSYEGEDFYYSGRERRDRRNHERRRRDGRSERSYERRHRRYRSNERGEGLGGVKTQVPSFQGKNDPEAYLEWETKVEQIFSYHHYNEERKVKVAALEFSDYALIWWDQVQKERERNREYPIDTWEEMKSLMRRRFVPSWYHRELHNKLQRLTQGSRSVDEYFKEMEVAMIRANVIEEKEATMARFLHGLNREIGDIVELQSYEELDDLVHQAIKVEQQIKRKGAWKKDSSNLKLSLWKDKQPKETSSTYSKEGMASKSSNKFPSTNDPSSSSSKSRNIKCFKCLGSGHIASQCPNKRTMVLRENGNISSDSCPNSLPTTEGEEEYEAYAPDGDLLMVRRLLGGQATTKGQNQRENIFHTRCLTQGKVCSLIIDSGSCTNVASKRMVTKLNLKTTTHPKPYKLQWLSEEGELLVDQQVLINFSIGKYEDEILCDVVPMETCHILLGRPWQFDRHTIYDGHSNKFSFVHNNCKFTLVSLTPREVCEDQKKMRIKREQERNVKKEENEGKDDRVGLKERKESENEGKKKEKERRKKSLFLKENEGKSMLLARQLMDSCSHSNIDILSSESNFLLQKIRSSNPRKKYNQDTLPMQMQLGQVPKERGKHSLGLIPTGPLLNRSTWERIGFEPRDRAYKDDMQGKSELHEKFKKTNLSSFNVGIGGLNSRTNFLKGGGNDGDQGRPSREKGRAKERESLIGLRGPIARARARKTKDILLEKEINTYKLKPKVEKKSSRWCT